MTAKGIIEPSLLFPNSPREVVYFFTSGHVHGSDDRAQKDRTREKAERNGKKCIVESITAEINKSGTKFTSLLVKSSGKRLCPGRPRVSTRRCR